MTRRRKQYKTKQENEKKTLKINTTRKINAKKCIKGRNTKNGENKKIKIKK